MMFVYSYTARGQGSQNTAALPCLLDPKGSSIFLSFRFCISVYLINVKKDKVWLRYIGTYFMEKDYMV